MQTIEEFLAVHTYLTADDLICDRCGCTCPPAAGDTCPGCDAVEPCLTECPCKRCKGSMPTLSNDQIIAYTEGRTQGKADVLSDLEYYDPNEHDMINPNCCDLCTQYREILYRLVNLWPFVRPWGMQGQSVAGGTDDGTTQ